jgi:Domain of unknown function (DUF222)
VTVAEVASRIAALQAAVAELAELAYDQIDIDGAAAVIDGVESAQRTLTALGYQAIQRLRSDPGLGRGRRLRDHLANTVHLSASEAGRRIATAADLAGEKPALPKTAAAARYGLIGEEQVRIIRDTAAKLPDTAATADRARLDLELTGVAVAERPEVLRQQAAL